MGKGRLVVGCIVMIVAVILALYFGVWPVLGWLLFIFALGVIANIFWD